MGESPIGGGNVRTDDYRMNYNIDRAILILTTRYEYIYQSLTDRKYILVNPAKGGGVSMAFVEESGLLELARSAEAAEYLNRS